MIRAETHLKAFQREIEAYSAREPHALIAEYHPEGPEGAEYVFRLRIFELPQPVWGAIAGDFIHNVRSALDYLAWQLVLSNNGKPDSAVQFPIFTASNDWTKKSARMVRLMNPRHIDLLERMQPYHAGRPHEHPLAVLNTLSNGDKHRVLTVPLMTIRAIGWDVIPLGPGITVDMDRSSGDLWVPPEDNAVIARVPVTVDPGVEPNVYLERHIDIEVSLDGSEEAVHSLSEIYGTAKSIFDTFVSEFRDELRE